MSMRGRQTGDRRARVALRRLDLGEESRYDLGEERGIQTL